MKNTILLTLLTLSFLFSLGQETEDSSARKGFQKEKLFFGGNFGLTFGDYTLINISPQVGYRFSNFFAAGVGLNVQHVSYKYRNIYTNDPEYKSSLWITGLNVFGRVYPINNVFIQAQPEANYIFGKERDYNSDLVTKVDAEIIPSLLLGGGASIPSGRGAFIAGVYYDVINHERSPYGERPFVQFGFNFYMR